jgi:hypothetical protein
MKRLTTQALVLFTYTCTIYIIYVHTHHEKEVKANLTEDNKLYKCNSLYFEGQTDI